MPRPPDDPVAPTPDVALPAGDDAARRVRDEFSFAALAALPETDLIDALPAGDVSTAGLATGDKRKTP